MTALYVGAAVVAALAALARGILLQPEHNRWRSARWWARDAVFVLALACVIGAFDALHGPEPTPRETAMVVAVAVASVAMLLNMLAMAPTKGSAHDSRSDPRRSHEPQRP